MLSFDSGNYPVAGTDNMSTFTSVNPAVNVHGLFASINPAVNVHDVFAILTELVSVTDRVSVITNDLPLPSVSLHFCTSPSAKFAVLKANRFGIEVIGVIAIFEPL